jgi:adenine-specific DNA-methyltransferase
MGRRWVTVELSSANVERYAEPRLRKVVEAQDPWGITSVTEPVAVSELPDGVSPQDAQQFVTLLSKFTDNQTLDVDVAKATAQVVRALDKSAESPLDKAEKTTLLRLLRKLDTVKGGITVDVMPGVLSQLRAASKTRNETLVNWKGGGGFTLARIGPSMYEVDDIDGTVYLSTAATNGAWSKAVAGQLRFTLTPDDPVFCGMRNRQRLAVVDGVADEAVVRAVVENLTEKERAVIVAKAVLPEAADLLKELSPGSRIRKAPEQMFPKATVK